MANIFFDYFKEKLLSGNIALHTDTIRVVLVDTGVDIPASGNIFLSAISSSARIGTPQTLTSKTLTSGVFDAADVTFTAVTGSSAEGVLIYKWVTDDIDSPLIAYIDTVSSGLPVTPNGGDITITWHATNGIFRLG